MWIRNKHTGEYENLSPDTCSIDITHWMPLPEPPK